MKVFESRRYKDSDRFPAGIAVNFWFNLFLVDCNLVPHLIDLVLQLLWALLTRLSITAFGRHFEDSSRARKMPPVATIFFHIYIILQNCFNINDRQLKICTISLLFLLIDVPGNGKSRLEELKLWTTSKAIKCVRVPRNLQWKNNCRTAQYSLVIMLHRLSKIRREEKLAEVCLCTETIFTLSNYSNQNDCININHYLIITITFLNAQIHALKSDLLRGPFVPMV